MEGTMRLNNTWKTFKTVSIPYNISGMIDLTDVKHRWPERYGHVKRICGLVESVAPGCKARVEIWDGGLNGCQGMYVPSDRLIKLWSGSSVLALTLVHELGHSLMRVGRVWWDKWDRDPYLSDPEELFARWFTQLVATETGDKTLCAQLDLVREFHWTDEEFELMSEVTL